MTIRDAMWALGGFWTCSALLVFTFWWHDTKSGVKSGEVPTALTKNMEQVEQVSETYKQIKEVTQINEAAYLKKWASFEKRLKQLEIQLAAQTALLDQYKGKHEVLVAKRDGRAGAPYSSGSFQDEYLPAHQLIQLAKEVGFGKVEVQ